jgi:hypothetical protein
MRGIWAVPACFLALPALAAEPFARAEIDNGGPIVPGQQIYLTVDVFTPDFFTSPPEFPLFDIPNALITLPDERAQNLTQAVDGVQYSGIRRRYAIVPEKTGTFLLPPIAIEFGYSSNGTRTKGVATTAATRFVVSAGRGGGPEIVFSARGLDIAQSFDRNPASLTAGDAMVRTIVVTAKDTQAMLMPPVDVGTVSGMRQYAKPPKIEDGIAAGRDTLSRRTETIVYTSTAAGAFLLPQIRYPWFDVAAKAQTTAGLPAMTVKVAIGGERTGIAPDLAAASPTTPFEWRRRVALGIGLVFAFAAVLWMGRRVTRTAARHLSAIWIRARNSRWHRLRSLRKTILSAAPLEVYSALQTWSRTEGFRTVHLWASSRHPELEGDIRGLEDMLYSGRGGDLDRKHLARCVASRTEAAARRASGYALPALNPGADTGSSPKEPASMLQHRK